MRLACSEANEDSIRNQDYFRDVTISTVFEDVVKGNDSFNLTRANFDRTSTNSNFNQSIIAQLMPITRDYFSRPEILNEFSHKQYSQNWRTSRKLQVSHSESEMYDQRSKVIVRRSSELGQDFILDLKFRVSPPDPRNEKWCVGALELHVPHRSIRSLLNDFRSFKDAYSYYRSLCRPDGTLVYPFLEKFETDEVQLHSTITSSGRPKVPNTSGCDSPEQHQPGDDDTHPMPDEGADIERHSDTGSIEEGVDGDNIFRDDEILALLNNLSSGCYDPMYDPECKSWDGTVANNYLSANLSTESYSDLESAAMAPADMHKQVTNALLIHKPYKTRILSGELPSNIEDDSDKMKLHFQDHYYRKQAADAFKLNTIQNCRSRDQRDTFDTLSNCIQQHYFGPSMKQSGASLNRLETYEPFLTVVGVPGSGKSWVLSSLREWINITIGPTQTPFTAAGIEAENDPVSRHLNDALSVESKKSYGRAPAMAYSGAAAGVIQGHTIHKALGFGRGDLSINVLKGFQPLKPLSATKRNGLFSLLREAKVLFY